MKEGKARVAGKEKEKRKIRKERMKEEKEIKKK